MEMEYTYPLITEFLRITIPFLMDGSIVFYQGISFQKN